MQPDTNSAKAPTEPQPKSWLQRLIDALDPDFPSAVIEAGGLAIEDRAEYGRETLKPDFVVADDRNFLGGAR